MKRIIITAIAFIVLITSCIIFTKETIKTKKEDTASITYRVEKNQNLIVEEIQLSTKNQEQESIESEQEFTAYIEQVNNDVEELTAKEELTTIDKTTLENTFITLTDFIFYDGIIKGTTFKELTDSAKQKVIELYEKIDAKIEEKMPNYKEKIKDTASKTYSNIKEKASQVKDEITSKYKEQIGEDRFNAQVETFEESKETMKESFEPVIKTIVEESKEIYEASKDKLDNWYQNWKEERQQ